jgi:ABC-type transport system involved in multi-copper enzyme maturation permease subunit
MTRIIRAELLRLVRRRTVTVIALGAVLFAVVATLTVFASARDSGVPSRRQGTTLAALAGTGGGTEAFAVGASFVGFFVFVTFIALVATEFSGGTIRAVLLREPRRVRVLVGKLVGALLVAAAAVALVEVCSFVISLAVAPSKDIATTDWFSLASAGDALRDYGTVLAGVTGWAVLGTMLAVIFRSTPLALAVGFAWAGPFENITVDSWSTGYRVFPGQVFASLIQGGTAELGLGRALLTATLYITIAGAVALLLFTRKDVTA